MEALELVGITKRFPRVVANNDVSLSVKQGSIHAIVGENGAGKSTLMSIAYGVQQPDAGEIRIDGKTVKIDNPSVAIQQGIGMVFQHFMLIPSLTVGENIIIGKETRKGLSLDLTVANRNIQKLADDYQLNVDPTALVGDLSVGILQRVEILKVLYRGADILIFDEPTAVLTPQEVEQLFRIMRLLVADGKTIVFITHKLDEVMEISDHVTVLRAGKVVGSKPTSQTNTRELANMMVGRDVLLRVEKRTARPKEPIFRVKDLSATGNHGEQVLKGISLHVKRGEILGVAGVEGNGQSELIQAITGLHPISEGRIQLEGVEIHSASVYERKRLGVGHIPEDRHKRGLVLPFSLADNLVLGFQRLEKYSTHGILKQMAIKQHAGNLATKYDIRPGDSQALTGMLSGGNQQKVVIARELSAGPKILIAAQPTRGVDIGAIEFIHRQLVEFSEQGNAVLLFSAELQEILSLSDRILVMQGGRIVGEMLASEATEEKLGLLMAGVGGGKQHG